MNVDHYRCRCGETLCLRPGEVYGCCVRARQVDAYLLYLLGLIDLHGWAIQGVMPTEDEPDFVPCAYTVGLTTHGQPEVVVYGLAPTMAQQILNSLAERMIGGEVIEVGREYDDVIANFYNVQFIEYHGDDVTAPTRLYLEVRVLELCLPDKHRRFQWEPGYEGPRR